MKKVKRHDKRRISKANFGKTVRYFLNYSAKEQSVAYKYSDGEDVLTGETIKAESLLIIPAWDVRIVEA